MPCYEASKLAKVLVPSWQGHNFLPIRMSTTGRWVLSSWRHTLTIALASKSAEAAFLAWLHCVRRQLWDIAPNVSFSCRGNEWVAPWPCSRGDGLGKGRGEQREMCLTKLLDTTRRLHEGCTASEKCLSAMCQRVGSA